MPIGLIIAILAFVGVGYAAKKQQTTKGTGTQGTLPPPPDTISNNMTTPKQFQWRPDAAMTARSVSDIAGVGGPQIYTPQGVRPDPTKLKPPVGGAIPAIGAAGGGSSAGGSGGDRTGGGFSGGGSGGSHPFIN